MSRAREAGELLVGEWACLACVAHEPAHGFGVAARMAPDGDVGRVVALSRPLTYRALDQLQGRGLVEVVGEERGRTGGVRTVFGPTAAGRALLDAWLAAPVADVGSTPEVLVLKVVAGDLLGRGRAALVDAQRAALLGSAAEAAPASGTRSDVVDPVAAWQQESAAAVRRFLDRLHQDGAGSDA